MHWATTVIRTAKPSSSASVPRRVGTVRRRRRRRGDRWSGPAISRPSGSSPPARPTRSSSESTSSRRSCPPGSGRPSRRRAGRVRRRGDGGGADGRGRGGPRQSGSRWSRSAARIRSASSASSAVMPPRTRLRAAGVRSATARPVSSSSSKKSKPTIETSRPRKTATCSVVAAAVDADEPVPEGPDVRTHRPRDEHDENGHRHQEKSQRAAAGGGATARRRCGCRRGWGGRIGERGPAGGGAGVDLALADVAAGRAVDDRVHAAAAAGVLDDVGDDHGDVVGAAAAQRQLDEPVGGGLRVGVLERLGEGLLADDAGQAVGAEQVAVAGPGLAHGEVGLDLLAVEGAQQQRALRVAVGLLGGDPAVVDQRLDERVVVGDLGQLAVAHQVGAGVADVAEAPAGRRRTGSR